MFHLLLLQLEWRVEIGVAFEGVFEISLKVVCTYFALICYLLFNCSLLFGFWRWMSDSDGAISDILVLHSSDWSIWRLFYVKLKTVNIFYSWIPEYHPIYRYTSLKIVFLCPLSLIPSSIIRLNTVISAVFLPSNIKSDPIIYDIAPGPFLQYFNILWLNVEPSEPICPKIPFWHISWVWACADFANPSWKTRGGSDFCCIRKFLASAHACLP